MSGRSEKSRHLLLECDGKTLSDPELANTLNNFFTSVSSDIPPLDLSLLPSFPRTGDTLPMVQPYEVCKKLTSIKPHKAHWPDNIPSRIFKEFAFEVSTPAATIFNVSLLSGVMPISWKESNIIPIPKVTKPTWESDIRPISLTPCLSKVLEDFVVSWLIEDVRDKIDPMQSGCLKGTSTSYCLLDMVHNWLLQLDSPNEHLRVCFLDFSKAFDRIGYNILVQKLINLNVRLCLIPWIINFLSDRKQRLKSAAEL